MSQYFSTLKTERKLLFGLDKPTGGYFLTEFYRDDEIKEDQSDVVFTASALTLTDLLRELETRYDIHPSADTKTGLLMDWYASPPPAQLQVAISRDIFGVDLMPILERVQKDVLSYGDTSGK